MQATNKIIPMDQEEGGSKQGDASAGNTNKESKQHTKSQSISSEDEKGDLKDKKRTDSEGDKIDETTINLPPLRKSALEMNNIEILLKSIKYEGIMSGISITYGILIGVHVIVEDIVTEQKRQEIELLGLDILQVLICTYYMVDLVLNIAGKGLKTFFLPFFNKLEGLCVIVIFCFSIVELTQTIQEAKNIRF